MDAFWELIGTEVKDMISRTDQLFNCFGKHVFTTNHPIPLALGESPGNSKS